MRASGGEATDVDDQRLGRTSYDKVAGLGAETPWPLGARLTFIVTAALLCWAIPIALYFLLRR